MGTAKRGKLEQDLQERNRRLKLLQSLTARSISSLASGRALKVLVDEVARGFGYSSCSVLLHHPDAAALSIVAISGAQPGNGVPAQFDLGDQEFKATPVARAFVEGSQTTVPEPVFGPLLSTFFCDRGAGQNAGLAVATPMEYWGERLGVFVACAPSSHEFDPDEFEFLRLLAAQAASIAGTSRAYQQLAESRECYRELYDRAADWIYSTDAGGVITECNRTMAAALGYPKWVLVGGNIHDFELKTKKGDDTALRWPEAGGKNQTRERNFVSAAGAGIATEVHASPVYDDSGKIARWRFVARDITSKKQAQRQIRLLAAAVESSRECVIVSGLDGEIISINKAGAGYFGYRRRELAGRNIRDLLSGANHHDLLGPVFRLSSAEGWQGQLLGRRSDGASFPVFVSFSQVNEEDGRPAALVAIARDVSTEQRMSQEIMRRNRELAVLNALAANAAKSLDLKHILQSMIASVVESMNYDGGVIFLCDDDCREFSLGAADSVPEKILRQIQDRYVLLIAKNRKAMFTQYAASGGLKGGASGAPALAALAGIPLLSKGRLLGVMLTVTAEPHDFNRHDMELLEAVGKTIAVAVDNTRLFNDVASAKTEWEATFDAMADGISIHAPDFTILRANQALAGLLGPSSRELVGKKCFQAVHGCAAPIDDCPMREAVATRESVTRIIEEPSLGRTLRISADPIVGDGGEILAVVHGVRDITEQERLQEQVSQKEKLTALGEMAGGVAHDFNNFLTVILGNTQLLLSGANAGADDRELLRTIERVANDAAETVRRIQEFTRVRTSHHFTAVDINEVVRNSIEVARPRWKGEADARSAPVELGLDIADVPLVKGNEAELGEVFVNLLLNAADALAGGGEISITTRTSGGRVEVLVADNGRGMNDDVRRRIFEPFFTTKGAAGSGLGLSVAYGIVNRHHGEISVESSRGIGTVFMVRLPALAAGSEERGLQPAETSGATRPARLLVIDDAVMIRDLLVDILKGMNHDVEAVDNGQAGVEMFANACSSSPPAFDLVFTDMGMPGMSGWEVAERIKGISPATPVVLVTGWGDQLDPARIKACKIDTVIAKPFRVDQIRAFISEALPAGKG